MRVVVLGANGMLGSMVVQHLNSLNRYQVVASTRKDFDAESFVDGKPQNLDLASDFIINCIGIIKPHCKDNDPVGVERAIKVNALFPHKLAALKFKNQPRIIQIATDCVYSGLKGQYNESAPHDPTDVYGKTKSLGEVFTHHLLNIRCSIIGPEKSGSLSLMSWLLSQKDGAEVNGFTHHLWNGVTTLQFAELCDLIMSAPGTFETLLQEARVHHFVPNNTVNKFELLQQIQSAFGRRFQIVPRGDVGPAVDRTLATQRTSLKKLFGETTLMSALEKIAQLKNGANLN